MILLRELSALSWWEWVVYAPSCASVLWLIVYTSWKLSTTSIVFSGLSMKQRTRPTEPLFGNLQERRRKARTAVKLGVLSFFLFGSGAWFRDCQLTRNTHTYYNATVQKISDTEWWVKPEGMRAYDFVFCRPANLDLGGPIDITYEQRLGCKSLDGSNHFELHEGVNDARREPAASATKTAFQTEARERARRGE